MFDSCDSTLNLLRMLELRSMLVFHLLTDFNSPLLKSTVTHNPPTNDAEPSFVAALEAILYFP